MTEYSNSNSNSNAGRPLGVIHLVFGLIFTGIAAIWLIGEANDTDIPDLAAAFPVVLIGAGIIGLAASVLNQRNAKARLLAAGPVVTPSSTDVTDVTDAEPAATEDLDEDTLVLNNEKDES